MLGELSCWAAFGVLKSDVTLMMLGGSEIVAPILMLHRIRQTRPLAKHPKQAKGRHDDAKLVNPAKSEQHSLAPLATHRPMVLPVQTTKPPRPKSPSSSSVVAHRCSQVVVRGCSVDDAQLALASRPAVVNGCSSKWRLSRLSIPAIGVAVAVLCSSCALFTLDPKEPHSISWNE